MSQTTHGELLPKGQFAALIGVSAARVSQYISEGKIGPDALVGEGRSAKVLVEVAKRQIDGRRDMSQALGNGLGTRLAAQGEAASVSPAPSAPRGDTVDDQFKREKLRGAQMANRKAAEEEAARAGRFVEADATAAEMTRIAAGLLQTFEGSLTAFAAAVAARFQVPQRDVLHLLREEFRAVRLGAAEQHRASAEATGETVDSRVEVEADDAA